jgi:LemA protein
MSDVKNLPRMLLIVAALLSASACSKDFKERAKAVNDEWTAMQTQLQRRDALLPPLIGALKAGGPDIQSLGQTLSAAHDRFAAAKTRDETIAAANDQSTAIQNIKTAIEANPALQSNEPLTRATTGVAQAEVQVAVERMRYNAQVQMFRTSRSTILGTLTYYATQSDDYPFYVPPILPGSGKPVPADFDLGP